jgi:hypothetical protein
MRFNLRYLRHLARAGAAYINNVQRLPKTKGKSIMMKNVESTSPGSCGIDREYRWNVEARKDGAWHGKATSAQRVPLTIFDVPAGVVLFQLSKLVSNILPSVLVRGVF